MTVDIQELARRHAIAGRIEFEHSPLGGPVVRLTGAGSTAVVALEGAQVLEWAPDGEAPVLWLSPTDRLGTGKALRGGIPVCWPWFALHPTDRSKPNHGFIRTRLWELVSATANAKHTTVELRTSTTAADRALWPHSAEVSLTVAAGASLEVSLETRNTGGGPFELTEALHTYFAVPDISKVSVEGFDGLDYIDKLDANARKHWAGPIRFEREVDRIYLQHTGAAAVADAGLGRRMEITKSGSTSSVVWNPWIDKCRRLGDMGPDGYRRMVCVETTNAGDDVVTLAPGKTHALVARIEIQAGR